MWKVVGVCAVTALLAGGSAQGARTTAPASTTPPVISGTERAGQTLTASSGSWSGSTPMTFGYRWQRCDKSGNNCKAISGATTGSTYGLAKNDAGHRVRVSVTATNSDGSANAVSPPTGVIAKGIPPESTASPLISGTPKAGRVLTATSGSWKNNPTSFDYQWLRCNPAGNDCGKNGSSKTTYQLANGDVGSTIRVAVTAKNQYGKTKATSAPTVVVVAGGPLPANTVAPTIAGIARDGEVLVAGVGVWTNSPTSYGYQWRRCDGAGNNCVDFGGDAASQALAPTEVGHTIRVEVAAKNQYGKTKATSGPTAVVVAATGAVSIPVDQVSQPNRLVISAVKFVPARLTTLAPFIGRFRISDTHGKLVRGALVYAVGLPYGWVRAAPESVSAADRWATIQFFPTRSMPLRRGALVFFVRARKPGEPVLAGVSTRRLVQVGIG